MATKEEDFKHRFVAVLKDLRENGAGDPEAMYLIGSLAARLMEKGDAPDWSSFKSTMTAPVYDKLLADFEQQGNQFHRDGKHKHAHAVQVLAMSLVARTQTDIEVRTGDEFLNGLVDFLIASYRKARAADAGAN